MNTSGIEALYSLYYNYLHYHSYILVQPLLDQGIYDASQYFSVAESNFERLLIDFKNNCLLSDLIDCR